MGFANNCIACMSYSHIMLMFYNSNTLTSWMTFCNTLYNFYGTIFSTVINKQYFHIKKCLIKS